VKEPIFSKVAKGLSQERIRPCRQTALCYAEKYLTADVGLHLALVSVARFAANDL